MNNQQRLKEYYHFYYIVLQHSQRGLDDIKQQRCLNLLQTAKLLQLEQLIAGKEQG